MVKNHDGTLLAAGQSFHAPKQIDLLARVQLLAEAARLAEHRRLAKNKRPRGPLVDPAQRVPDSCPDAGHERGPGMRIVEPDGAPAGETSRTDGVRSFKKKLPAWLGI